MVPRTTVYPAAAVDPTGEEHDQAVDPDPEACRRRHATLQRVQEVLVDIARLLVSCSLMQ